MQKRKLEELNLLDDFLFGKMVTYPKIGEMFSRALLEIILQRKFGKLTIVPQKDYYGANTDLHGARLDVYIEEEAQIQCDDNRCTGEEVRNSQMHNAVIYDIEPENDSRAKSVCALPKRVRFYHAKIDAESLESGQHYHLLKSVIIIMITSFDPFREGRMIYTIKNCCVEQPDMPYEDGAKTIFLYTKGVKGNAPEELQQLLKYMESTTYENAKSESLKKIHRMVEQVKHEREVLFEYMKIFEREEMLRDLGRDEERVNTERERQRADAAEARASTAEARASKAETRAGKAEALVRQLQEKVEELQCRQRMQI